MSWFKFFRRAKAVHNRPADVYDIEKFSGRQKAADYLYMIHAQLCHFYLIDPMSTMSIRLIRDYEQNAGYSSPTVEQWMHEVLTDFYPRQGMHRLLNLFNDIPPDEIKRRNGSRNVSEALERLFEKDTDVFGLKIPE